MSMFPVVFQTYTLPDPIPTPTVQSYQADGRLCHYLKTGFDRALYVHLIYDLPGCVKLYVESRGAMYVNINRKIDGKGIDSVDPDCGPYIGVGGIIVIPLPNEEGEMLRNEYEVTNIYMNEESKLAFVLDLIPKSGTSTKGAR